MLTHMLTNDMSKRKAGFNRLFYFVDMYWRRNGQLLDNWTVARQPNYYTILGKALN